MAKAYKKRVLGRGLSAILNDNEQKANNSSVNFNDIDINLIRLKICKPMINSFAKNRLIKFF